MTEKIMQPIFFVELCSQITSRVVFRSYKPICTFIWMPSKYTQMSLKPNHYLEPCHKGYETLVEFHIYCSIVNGVF